jgi:undecaprenyl-diphosphatase
LCILVTLAIVEPVTVALKSAVDRLRPKQAQRVRMVELPKASPKFLKLFKEPIVRYSDASDRNRSGPSFPSGHMANNTAVAICLTLFYRWRGALCWILTALIGYSRIYLGAHWPSDIVATFFLATGEALIIIALLEVVWRTAARKFAPDFFARHPSLIVNVGQVSNLSEPQVANLRHKE